MAGLWFYAVTSGILFGVWPILMQRSGITNVYISTAVMEAIVFFTLLPLGIVNLGASDYAKMNWPFTVGASVCAAIGVLLFNSGIAKVPLNSIGTFFVLMIVVQITVPAVFQVLLTGFSRERVLGFMFAGLAAYFLSK